MMLRDIQAEANKHTGEDLGTARRWVREELRDIIRIAKGHQQVRGHDGQLRYTTDLSAANRALELLGKESGMFAERLLTGDIDREIEGRTVEELEALLKTSILRIGPTTLRRLIGEVEPQLERPIETAANRTNGGET
jgi:hypothetical protein